MGFLYVTHPDLGDQGGVIADDPAVINLYKAKGWVVQDLPTELDPESANGPGKPAKIAGDQDEANGPGPVKDQDQAQDQEANGPGYSIPPHVDPDEVNGPNGLALLRAKQAQEEDQNQPPKKSTKKAAASGDNQKEGVIGNG